MNEAADDFGMEDLECKICYCAYSLSGWQPRVLECHHHLCAKCLAKIIDLSESSPSAVVCPFCRYVTSLPAGVIGSLPNRYNLLTVMSIQNCGRLRESQPEILPTYGQVMDHFTPTSPSSVRSSNMVITIMSLPWEPAELASRIHHSSSLVSTVSVTWPWMVWNCVAMLCQTLGQALLWLLGMLYFGSLPLGVYMLIIQETTLGMLLICLVPVSMLLGLLYGLCHCLCHEFWNCVSS